MMKTVADYPELVAQWHPTKNGNLTPDMVSAGSEKKIWWLCPVSADHEWEASVYNRKNGSGCACCRGLKVVYSNCLATLYPEIAAEWHPTKNGDLKPNMVTVGTQKKVWWKCSIADDHEWEMAIANRISQKQGCSCCSNKKVVTSNCLVTTHPEIAAEWHPTKNGDLLPNMVTAGSDKKVWWKCLVVEDHEWQAKVYDRKKAGCSCCNGKTAVPSNCLATTHPEIAAEWHPIKNGDLMPNMVTAGSHKKVWWKCSTADDHEWESEVCGRTAKRGGAGCPCCLGLVVVPSNCLATTHPEIAAEWHPTKNGNLTPSMVTISNQKKAWWKCPIADDHEWQSMICNRKISGCPCCDGKKVVLSNCLATIL
jgi:hypothetical protein